MSHAVKDVDHVTENALMDLGKLPTNVLVLPSTGKSAALK